MTSTRTQASMLVFVIMIFLAVVSIFVIHVIQQDSIKSGIKAGEYFPQGATDIVDQGNGWHTFTFDGRKYLHHYEASGYHASESITEISPQ